MDIPTSSEDVPDGLPHDIILDNVEALIYVADIESNELLYMNKYGREKYAPTTGKRCWEVLQKDQTGPCSFCTNPRLVDDEGNSTGVYTWEFQNTVTEQWFQCIDKAIRWNDGRMVRIEIATDISLRKEMEHQLEQERLKAEQLATTDMLTGLRNRRAFFTLGEQLLREATRFNQPVSLIMLDLDHFKRINDQYGHAAGDAVLTHVSRLMLATVREADIAARMGGEEFVLLLPQTRLSQATQLAERLRARLDQTPASFNNQALHCTASFGTTCTELPAVTTLDDLLNQADRNLYKAKDHGRNCIS